MENVRPKRSLRGQMTFILLLCWLLPMLLAAGALGGYLAFGLGRQSQRAIAEQFQLNLRMGADRVESAVEASRLPSYDPELREAWSEYRQGENYALLYRRCSSLFTRLYQSDSRFRYAVFCFSDDPEDRAITVVNSGSGASERQVRERWRDDLPAVAELAGGLDTAVGFLNQDGQVYLVRNLLDSTYRTIGVLALALNQPYYFEDLSLLSWASAVSVELGPDTVLTVKGEAPPPEGDGVLEVEVTKRDCVLRGRASADYDALLAGFGAYRYMLGAMALSLLLLLLLTFRFFRRKISQPIEALMAGAADIQEGQWGRQIDCRTGSREFEYLTGSFNQMSAQLQNQFNRLYQEELARRDAQIKASNPTSTPIS